MFNAREIPEYREKQRSSWTKSFQSFHIGVVLFLTDCKCDLSPNNSTPIREQASPVGFPDNVFRFEFFCRHFFEHRYILCCIVYQIRICEGVAGVSSPAGSHALPGPAVSPLLPPGPLHNPFPGAPLPVHPIVHGEDFLSGPICRRNLQNKLYSYFSLS